MRRCALHGIGEPLLNRELPRMIAYLKERGVEVLFNSNGTLLTPAWQEALARSGLDQFRCSIDGARPETYAHIRGANLLHKVAEGLTGLAETKARLGVATPQVSIWYVATRRTLSSCRSWCGWRPVWACPGLPAADGLLRRGRGRTVRHGPARPGHFRLCPEPAGAIIAECEALSAELGIAFHASGARDLRNSLAAQRPAESAPWRACMRPWTTAYVTANGNCLPCCISPFSTADYDSLLMGNLFERPLPNLERRAYRSFARGC